MVWARSRRNTVRTKTRTQIPAQDGMSLRARVLDLREKGRRAGHTIPKTKPGRDRTELMAEIRDWQKKLGEAPTFGAAPSKRRTVTRKSTTPAKDISAMTDDEVIAMPDRVFKLKAKAEALKREVDAQKKLLAAQRRRYVHLDHAGSFEREMAPLGKKIDKAAAAADAEADACERKAMGLPPVKATAAGVRVGSYPHLNVYESIKNTEERRRYLSTHRRIVLHETGERYEARRKAAFDRAKKIIGRNTQPR